MTSWFYRGVGQMAMFDHEGEGGQNFRKSDHVVYWYMDAPKLRTLRISKSVISTSRCIRLQSGLKSLFNTLINSSVGEALLNIKFANLNNLKDSTASYVRSYCRKKLTHEKITFRMYRAQAGRENVFRLLHKASNR